MKTIATISIKEEHLDVLEEALQRVINSIKNGTIDNHENPMDGSYFVGGINIEIEYEE